MNNGNTNRIVWIDMAKGYGIILVVFAHLYSSGPLKSWIFSFHLPLFFFISGYLFKSGQPFVVFLNKKIKSLLIPYLTLGFIVIVFYTYISRAISIPGIIDILLSYFFQQRFINIWFITCLFLLEVLFFFIEKYIKTDLGLLLVSLFSVMLGILYSRIASLPLYWNADACFMALPFYSIGFQLKRRNIIEKMLMSKSNSVALFLIFLVLNVISWRLYFVKGYTFDMYFSSYNPIILTYISAFAGILFTIIGSDFVEIDSIKYIGENSMIYFVLHQYVIFPIINFVFEMIKFKDIMSNILPSSFSSHIFLILCIIKTVITIILTTVLNEIILKSKYKFILGK